MTNRQKRLLIVDDDQLFCDAVQDYFSHQQVAVTSAIDLNTAGKILLVNSFDVILLDNQLPDGKGIKLLSEALKSQDRTKVIFITGFPNFKNAVEALKKGAYDYLSKPIDLEELGLMVENAFRARELEQWEEIEHYKADKATADNMLIGRSEAFHHIQDLIAKAARTDATVLITGETGTGKNVIAQAIHYQGSSSTKPFVSVNCAALPENLIEAELFGVEKGAYTGATTRKGTFELAEGGTLFLDEIAEMPYTLQSKLLTAIEDHKIKRIGGEHTRQISVRIVAATNIDPQHALKEAKLRKDLYYRLGVIHIHVPPLRERREDIPPLCQLFTKMFAPQRNTYIAETELLQLMDYHWPGNIRELRNIIERCAILQPGAELHPMELLSAYLPKATPLKTIAHKEIFPLAKMEKDYILSALGTMAGNYTKTAAVLDISLSTLKRKLREYGLR